MRRKITALGFWALILIYRSGLYGQLPVLDTLHMKFCLEFGPDGTSLDDDEGWSLENSIFILDSSNSEIKISSGVYHFLFKYAPAIGYIHNDLLKANKIKVYSFEELDSIQDFNQFNKIDLSKGDCKEKYPFGFYFFEATIVYFDTKIKSEDYFYKKNQRRNCDIDIFTQMVENYVIINILDIKPIPAPKRLKYAKVRPDRSLISE